MSDTKELIFGGICLGVVCTECNGSKGRYLTIVGIDGKVDFEYGGWRGEDPIWRECKVCRGKGIIDSEEGAVLRLWMSGSK